MERLNSLREAVGKKLTSVEVIRAEFGRTNSQYTCLIFDDKYKIIVEGHGSYFPSPKPPIEEMKKAPNFFSAEDIADAVLKEEQKVRQRKKEKEQMERAEYEALKKKFEQ